MLSFYYKNMHMTHYRYDYDQIILPLQSFKQQLSQINKYSIMSMDILY